MDGDQEAGPPIPAERSPKERGPRGRSGQEMRDADDRWPCRAVSQRETGIQQTTIPLSAVWQVLGIWLWTEETHPCPPGETVHRGTVSKVTSEIQCVQMAEAQW